MKPRHFWLLWRRNLGHHFDNPPSAMEEARVSLQITLPLSIDEKLTAIQKQLDLRSKSSLIERILQEVFDEIDETTD